MKFESEKSALVALVTFSISAVIITLLIVEIVYNAGKNIFFPLLCMFPVGFLLWLWFGTEYEISGSTFRYQSGPIRGSIEVASIREIRKKSGGFVGMKPALSTQGLIICYNKYDEIFISPENKKAFIAGLLEVNPAIKLNFESTSDNGIEPGKA